MGVKIVRLTQEEFLKRSENIHKCFYDYGKAIYTGVNNKVIIGCPLHGEFEQVAGAHMDGRGCKECGKIKNFSKITHSKEIFVNRSTKTHDNFYSYEKVEYINIYNNVEITCPIHGSFFQTPTNHYKGKGCPNCGRIKAVKKRDFTTDKFIKRAIEKHTVIFDYSEVVYKGMHIKVNIKCEEHGVFKQTPANHLNGYGCPNCGKANGLYNIKRAERHKEEWLLQYAIVYFIKIEDKENTYYKVGITRTNVEARFKRKEFIRTDLIVYETNLYNAVMIEQSIIKENKHLQYLPDKEELNGGRTECFSTDISDKVTEKINQYSININKKTNN